MSFCSSHRISRRMLLGSGLAFSALAPAMAQKQFLDINPNGNFHPINIAVTPFVGSPDAADLISKVMTANFGRSIYLAPMDPGSFPEQIANPDQPPNLSAWRAKSAQYVVTGRASSSGGQMRGQFRLWDVGSGQQVAGQQYVTDAQNARRVAHKMSDQIFEHATGQGGFFDSRVVFVDGTGSALKRRKRLAIMDQDGANVRYLTRGDDLVVTPRFSPTAQEVAYMSFGSDKPKVKILNVETGQGEVVGNFPGMTFSPRFSPNGRTIVMALSQGSASNIYALNLGSNSTMRLTDSPSIDAAPCYSPDGSQIAFESDRGGTQQIYIMSASGGSANRISFGSGRYSTPVWSPKGDLIAFTRQSAGLFSIGVMKPDGSGQRILTEGFHNEGPTWSPNGLFLMFFRDPGGESGSHIFMTDVFGRGVSKIQTPHFASDPAWGPLRS
ncbi:MAG: Tol-Pal system protein TolB [Hyphomicrobiales bacterium]|nr:Tol-Pal system protein TolB [Hyphomicrobiales bacterium]MDE2115863.1 Tol-Pal system protein TolB [Hyphomicrobiales bacterium]